MSSEKVPPKKNLRSPIQRWTDNCVPSTERDRERNEQKKKRKNIQNTIKSTLRPKMCAAEMVCREFFFSRCSVHVICFLFINIFWNVCQFRWNSMGCDAVDVNEKLSSGCVCQCQTQPKWISSVSIAFVAMQMGKFVSGLYVCECCRCLVSFAPH